VSFEFNGGTCLISDEITIQIDASQSTTPVPDYNLCDSNTNGVQDFDIDSKIQDVLDTLPSSSYIISFHTSLEQAQQDTNPISGMYSNISNPQTIYARVENTGDGCVIYANFDLVVTELPQVNVPSPFTICDTGSQNGQYAIDLNEKNEEITGNNPNLIVSYHSTELDAQNRTNTLVVPYVNTSAKETLYASVFNPANGCVNTTPLDIRIIEEPELNANAQLYINACDSDQDGEALFDLSGIIPELLTDPDQYTVRFFERLNDAESNSNHIENAEAYANTQPFFQRIYMRVESISGACHLIETIDLYTNYLLSNSSIEDVVVCDADQDGVELFDLNAIAIDIINGIPDVTLSFYRTEEDRENELNPIDTNVLFENTMLEQTLFINLYKDNCRETADFQLSLIQIQTFANFEICSNFEQSVDLRQITPIAVEDPDGLEISYHLSASDAENNINPLGDTFFYGNTTENLYIRVESPANGCFSTYGFEILVNSPPRFYDLGPFEYCDDDEDGVLLVDLSENKAAVLGNQNLDNISLSYYSSQEEASSGINPIDNNYQLSDGEQLFTRAEDLTTGCFDTAAIYYNINPKPLLDIGDQTVCLDNLPLLVSAASGVSSDSYLWSTGETTPEISITDLGEYWVTVTTADGCATTEIFNVIGSESATIEFTEVLDFSDPNNITISISGIGDYLYVLDDGAPQESNVFENVSLGYHTITIIDLNGCAPTTKEVLVIDAPKFFTPNNDGQFDTWHITGVETLPGTEVYIYDRYGKLLKKLAWNGPGWDGSFNGAAIRADDYWYRAYIRGDQIAFEVTGHFTLRR
jgi:gliding motility-associated-like protein